MQRATHNVGIHHGRSRLGSLLKGNQHNAEPARMKDNRTVLVRIDFAVTVTQRNYEYRTRLVPSVIRVIETHTVSNCVDLPWGLRPQTPGIYRFGARMTAWLAERLAPPRAIPAAESALRSHPCVAVIVAPKERSLDL